MKISSKPLFSAAVILGMTAALFLSSAQAAGQRTRIYIVDSYHPEYLWSQETAQGAGQALVDLQFLDHERQARELNAKNYAEGSRTVVKKAWMDTKRKNSKREIADATAKIVGEIRVFQPDILLLGDDNAANYIGNHFIDTEVPVVFWGINGLPLKYGLIDSLDRPGHNVTGVYQAGYIKESIEYLLKLVPSIKTMAVLSDDSETGRARTKELQLFAHSGQLPVELKEAVVTNSYSAWQAAALRLASEVDAFFIFNHNTLKNDEGRPVDQMEAGNWYLTNIQKPDCSDARQFVDEGVLLVVDDSGFKQGYEAVRNVFDILKKGRLPADFPVRAPDRGAVIVNRERARQLGIDLGGADFVEEFVDQARALKAPAARTATAEAR